MNIRAQRREKDLEGLPTQDTSTASLTPELPMKLFFFMCVSVGGGWRTNRTGQREKEGDREKGKKRE